MKYIARVTKEGRHWLAEFPDAPGCQTFASSQAELQAMATDALVGWIETAMEHGRELPRPKARRLEGTEQRLVSYLPSGLAPAMALR